MGKGELKVRYRKIEIPMWADRKFRELSAPPPNARDLWIYLLCGPRTCALPGLVLATEGVIAADLGWELEGFRKAFAEVSSKGMAKADWNAGVVMLSRALMTSRGPRETARPENPNVLKHWLTFWLEVPECDLKDEYAQQLKVFAEALGESYTKAFREGFARASPERIGDQEQEQDLDQSPPLDLDRAKSSPSGADPDPDRGGGGDLVQRGRFTPLVNRFLARVNAARAEVGTKHKLGPVRPVALFGHGGGGERDLVARLTASADPARDLEHVLDVAIAEAGAKGELRWLSWSVASEKAWRACLASTVQEVTRRRPRGRGPGSAAPRNDHGTESADCSEVFG